MCELISKTKFQELSNLNFWEKVKIAKKKKKMELDKQASIVDSREQVGKITGSDGGVSWREGQ